MPLKRRRTEIEVSADNHTVTDLRRKRSSSRIDHVNFVAKTYRKDSQPFSNRSNTLANEGSKFVNMPPHIKRICTPAVSKKRKAPSSTIPNSNILPSMSSNCILNETFETAEGCDQDATIILGPSADQRLADTLDHSTMPQTNNSFLQRFDSFYSYFPRTNIPIEFILDIIEMERIAPQSPANNVLLVAASDP